MKINVVGLAFLKWGGGLTHKTLEVNVHILGKWIQVLKLSTRSLIE